MGGIIVITLFVAVVLMRVIGCVHALVVMVVIFLCFSIVGGRLDLHFTTSLAAVVMTRAYASQRNCV